MKAKVSLEERMAAIEEAISELQQQVAVSQSINWLQEITGSFKYGLAFKEILACGKAIRTDD